MSFRLTVMYSALACIVAVAGGLFLASTGRRGHGDARERKCISHLKQLQGALMAYHDTYGSFPPAYTVDNRGNKLHSWRVLVLPFVDQRSLYTKVKLDEPWDSVANRQLSRLRPEVFSCPAAQQGSTTATSYVGIVGDDTAWPEAKPTCIADWTDGQASTLLLLEIEDSQIDWMEPKDELLVEIDNAKWGRTSGRHGRFVNCVMGNGTIVTLHYPLDRRLLHRLSTIAGREDVSGWSTRDF